MKMEVKLLKVHSVLRTDSKYFATIETQSHTIESQPKESERWPQRANREHRSDNIL